MVISEEDKKILDMFHQGYSYDYIAQKTFYTKTNIYQNKIYKLLPIIKKRQNRNLDTQAVVNDYYNGLKIMELSKKYNAAAQTITQCLCKAGITEEERKQIGIQRMRKTKTGNTDNSKAIAGRKKQAPFLSDETFQQKVIEQYLQGYSQRTLATIHGISSVSVNKVIKEKSGLTPEELRERQQARFRELSNYSYKLRMAGRTT